MPPLLEQQFVDQLFCLWTDDLVLWIFDKLPAAIFALMVLLAIMDMTILDGSRGCAVRQRISVHPSR